MIIKINISGIHKAVKSHKKNPVLIICILTKNFVPIVGDYLDILVTKIFVIGRKNVIT